MKKVQVFVTAMFVGFIAFCMVSSANATMVNITSATPYIASGDQTDVPEIEAIIFPLMVSGSIEVYRVTPGNPNTEQFAFSGSYQTTFLPDYLSKEDAKIEFCHLENIQ